MEILKPSIDHIFNIRSSAEFKQLSLAVFRYQASENEVYNNYLKTLKIDSDSILELEQIPFLPIEFFKTHKIVTSSKQPTLTSEIFTSSGTSGIIQSKHYVSDITIYEKSYRKGFEYFYGNIEEYCNFQGLKRRLLRQQIVLWREL